MFFRFIFKILISLTAIFFTANSNNCLGSPALKVICVSYLQWPDCLIKTARCSKQGVLQANKYLGAQIQLVEAQFLPDNSIQTLTWREFTNHLENIRLNTLPTDAQIRNWIPILQSKRQTTLFFESPGIQKFFKKISPKRLKEFTAWLQNQIIENLEIQVHQKSWQPFQLWSAQYLFESAVNKVISSRWNSRSFNKNLELFDTLDLSIQLQIQTFSQAPLEGFFDKFQEDEVLSQEKIEALSLLWQLTTLQGSTLPSVSIGHLQTKKLPKWLRSSRRFIQEVQPTKKSSSSQDTSWTVWWNAEIAQSLKRHHSFQNLFIKTKKLQPKSNDKRRKNPLPVRISFEPLTKESNDLIMIVQVDTLALD